MFSAYLNGTSTQAAEPYHAQPLGRAMQARGVSQICTDQFCKEETLFGSPLKVVMTSQVIPVLILPEVISSFIRIANESLICFLTINKRTKEEMAQNYANVLDTFLFFR